MTDNEILQPTYGDYEAVSVEILNDDIDSERFDDFPAYVMQAEDTERSHYMNAYFSADFLVIDIQIEKIQFVKRNPEADAADFEKYMTDFYSWYKAKAEEFFLIKEIEFLIEPV